MLRVQIFVVNQGVKPIVNQGVKPIVLSRLKFVLHNIMCLCHVYIESTISLDITVVPTEAQSFENTHHVDNSVKLNGWLGW